MYRVIKTMLSLMLAVAFLAGASLPAGACTGITLKAKDGAVVYGRTLEWGHFPLNSRITVVPRGHAYQGQTPDGKPGYKWQAKYGFVGLDALHHDVIVEGMNEKGLAMGLFYHPGFCDFQKYEPAKAASTIGGTQVAQLILSTCTNLAQAKAALAKVRVVMVGEKELGIAPQAHYMIVEPSGKAMVLEFTNGEPKIYDAPLGVITNSPNYDWHMTNLRNYVNISPVALPDKKIQDIDFKPLGAGSGMIGLPGDFTPPNRFVRAVAFSQSARPTKDGPDTIYEFFRILDNFNVPLDSAEGAQLKTKADNAGLRSATLWTTANDTKNRVFYYHTQYNRRVRKVDLKKIDFGKPGVIHQEMDKVKAEDIQDVTPVQK